MSKIKLNVLGISYSQTQTGAYALVLTEEKGDRRIPIIVGGFEAQSIAIQLEGLNPPRPLTHDLFFNFAKAFKINILEVNIYKLEEGVFYSRLICDNGKNKIIVDARTSDAIALALRFKCAIFTTEEIMNRSGIKLEFEKEKKKSTEGTNTITTDTGSEDKAKGTEFASMETNKLRNMMQEAIEKEDYERASQIRDEIQRRGEEV
jgi:uncharacterized protein